MRNWAPVIVIGVVFVALCAAFLNSTPYRTPGVLLHQKGPDGPAKVPDVGAPDERQHANYVAHVMEGKGLPVFNPSSPSLFEEYQFHQPVLYYGLAAVWAKVTGSQPGMESGRGIRWLNVLIGLGTIAALALGAYWATSQWSVAWAASAVALMPMNLALHSAISNDPLLILLCTWTMALLAKCLNQGWALRDCVATGLCVGLACLTKTTAVTLLPVVLLALFVSRRGDTKAKASSVAAVLIPALALAVPWWLRNQSLYGDPLALTAFKEAFVGSPQASAFIEGFGAVPYWTQWVGWWTARSAIGVFGYMDIFMFEGIGMDKSGALYTALWVVLLIPLIAGLFAVRKGAGEEKVNSRPWWVWGAFSLLVLLAFVRFNLQYFQGQARYLYPALGPFAWLLGAGAVHLAKSKQSIAWVVVATSLALLDLVAYNELVAGFARRLT